MSPILRWAHDGLISQTVLSRPGDKRGKTTTFTLDSSGVVRNIEWMELSTGSNNGWCIDEIRLKHDGTTKIRRTTDHWLDAPDDSRWRFVSRRHDIQYTRGDVRWVFPGLPLRRAGGWRATNTFTANSPNDSFSFCEPPRRFDAELLESMIALTTKERLERRGAKTALAKELGAPQSQITKLVRGQQTPPDS